MTEKITNPQLSQFLSFCKAEKYKLTGLDTVLMSNDAEKLKTFFAKNKFNDTHLYAISHYLATQNPSQQYLGAILDEMLKKRIFSFYPNAIKKEPDKKKLSNKYRLPLCFAALTTPAPIYNLDVFVDKLYPYKNKMNYHTLEQNNYEILNNLDKVKINTEQPLSLCYLNLFHEKAAYFISKLKLLSVIDSMFDEDGMKKQKDFIKTLSSIPQEQFIFYTQEILKIAEEVDVPKSYMDIIFSKTFGKQVNFNKKLTKSQLVNVEFDIELIDVEKVHVALEKKAIELALGKNNIPAGGKKTKVKVL